MSSPANVIIIIIISPSKNLIIMLTVTIAMKPIFPKRWGKVGAMMRRNHTVMTDMIHLTVLMRRTVNACITIIRSTGIDPRQLERMTLAIIRTMMKTLKLKVTIKREGKNVIRPKTMINQRKVKRLNIITIAVTKHIRRSMITMTGKGISFLEK